MLAQQAGIALANQRLHARQRASAEELRAANATLAARDRGAPAEHRHPRPADQRLARQRGPGRHRPRAARAHGSSDRHRGQARQPPCVGGPRAARPLPQGCTPEERARLLRRTGTDRPTIRDGDRLITVAGPVDDVLGVVVLFDPDGTAGEPEHVALEHGATVLAVELGTAPEPRRGRAPRRAGPRRRPAPRHRRRARPRACAGVRLRPAAAPPGRRRRGSRRTGHAQRPAARRCDGAARDLGIGSLLAIRDGSVVLLAQHDGPWSGAPGRRRRRHRRQLPGRGRWCVRIAERSPSIASRGAGGDPRPARDIVRSDDRVRRARGLPALRQHRGDRRRRGVRGRAARRAAVLRRTTRVGAGANARDATSTQAADTKRGGGAERAPEHVEVPPPTHPCDLRARSPTTRARSSSCTSPRGRGRRCSRCEQVGRRQPATGRPHRSRGVSPGVRARRWRRDRRTTSPSSPSGGTNDQSLCDRSLGEGAQPWPRQSASTSERRTR